MTHYDTGTCYLFCVHLSRGVSRIPCAVHSLTLLTAADWEVWEILTNARKYSCIRPQAPVTGSSTHCAWPVLTPSPGKCLEGSRKYVEALVDAVVPGGVGGAALDEGGRDIKGDGELSHCHAKCAQERTLGGLLANVLALGPLW